MESSDSQVLLANALKRALDAYLAGALLPKPRPRTARTSKIRQFPFNRTPATRLSMLIQQELRHEHGNGDETESDEAPPQPPQKKRAGETFRRTPISQMLELIKADGAQPDTSAIALRAARYMEGLPEPPWQYIAVSMAPAFPVELPSGWELAPVDLVRDGKLPLSYGIGYQSEYSPSAFHLTHGYGVLRHPAGNDDVKAEEPSDDRGRVLTLPLLVLNLASDHPVHAGPCYYVEPGRRIIRYPPSDPMDSDEWFPPGELHAWEHLGQDRYGIAQARPRVARSLDANATGHLARLAPTLGDRITRLDEKLRRQLIRVADQYLSVVHRTPGTPDPVAALPDMYPPETVFRWISVIESLVNTGDGSQGDLTRRTAQRAAVLVGHNDEDRIATRHLVTKAYSARSAYAHGGRSNDNTDLATLRTLTRKIITSWIVLASGPSGDRLFKTLDDALLSAKTLDESVRRPLEEFHDQVLP